jgi:hypothetical protein
VSESDDDQLTLMVDPSRILLDDVPLPAGNRAIVELNLLGWALVGAMGGNLDRRQALCRALAEANVPAVGATIHTISVRNGIEVGESWQQSRLDGTGRHGSQVDEAARAAAFEVRVNLDEHPASSRLRGLIALLEPDVPPADLEPARNALMVAERLPDVADPELTRTSDMIGAWLADETVDVTAVPQALLVHKETRRNRLAIDARTASTMLLAAHIPQFCANSHSYAGNVIRTHRELLALSTTMMRCGTWLELNDLIVIAAERGHLENLVALADHLQAQAIAHRDYAMASPADPLEFTRRVFEIAPYAIAAVRICAVLRGALADQISTPTHDMLEKIATEAEELGVRTGDSLDLHYLHWATGFVHDERRAVAAEIATARAGYRHAVFQFLQDGEFRLLRPRSYRGFIEGKDPTPPTAIL